MDYKQKYLKYKQKYMELQKQMGGELEGFDKEEKDRLDIIVNKYSALFNLLNSSNMALELQKLQNDFYYNVDCTKTLQDSNNIDKENKANMIQVALFIKGKEHCDYANAKLNGWKFDLPYYTDRYIFTKEYNNSFRVTINEKMFTNKKIEINQLKQIALA
jgi:hypothetical protein